MFSVVVPDELNPTGKNALRHFTTAGAAPPKTYGN